MIEQDALNEISCLQVLKILITKAYSEIAELEDEILMLQSQLVCACADKGSYDMCFAVLHKKIDNLESLLRALKNENEQVCNITCSYLLTLVCTCSLGSTKYLVLTYKLYPQCLWHRNTVCHMLHMELMLKLQMPIMSSTWQVLEVKRKYYHFCCN